MEKKIRVTGAIIVKGDKVLAGQRGYGPLKGKWEFPGGKAKEHESDKDALTREIKEELEIDILVDKLVATVNAKDAQEKDISISFYTAYCADENLSFNAHDAFLWVDMAHIEELDWLPADKAIISDIEKILENNRKKGECK